MNEQNLPPKAPDNASRSRPQNKWKWRAFYAIGGVAFIWALTQKGAEMNAQHSAAALPSETAQPAQVAAQKPARIECTTTGRDYGVRDDVILRTGPRADAAPIRKAGAPDDADAAVYSTVSGSTPLREQCRNGEWARVSVLAPEYLRWMSGWVPTSSLKQIKVDAAGRRVYGATDIDWQRGSEAHKAVIVKIANKIMAENKACDAIDSASLLVEGDPSQPQFSLSCVGKGGTTPIAFTADDLRNGRSFAAEGVQQAAADNEQPIDKVDAFAACKEAITAQLRQPGSLDFHLFGTTFTTDGLRARFTDTFTAKNGFGNEMESTAECVFEGQRLLSATVIR